MPISVTLRFVSFHCEVYKTMATGSEMVAMLQESGMSYNGIAKAVAVQPSTIFRIAKGSRPRQALYDRLTALCVKRLSYRRKLYNAEIEFIPESERSFLRDHECKI